jgi:hypothetical protein
MPNFHGFFTDKKLNGQDYYRIQYNNTWLDEEQTLQSYGVSDGVCSLESMPCCEGISRSSTPGHSVTHQTTT